jgi:hypothetical protein
MKGKRTVLTVLLAPTLENTRGWVFARATTSRSERTTDAVMGAWARSAG